MPQQTEGHLALFWDESFLWGLLGYRTLSRLSLPFEVLTSEEIRKGGLDSCDILLVPGGWARDKSDALGAKGREKVKEFVRSWNGVVGEMVGTLPCDARMSERPSGHGYVVLRETRKGLWPPFGREIRFALSKRPGLLCPSAQPWGPPVGGAVYPFCEGDRL